MSECSDNVEDDSNTACSMDSKYNINSAENTEIHQMCRACESTDVAFDLAVKENSNLLRKFRACVDIEVSIAVYQNKLYINAVGGFYLVLLSAAHYAVSFR